MPLVLLLINLYGFNEYLVLLFPTLHLARNNIVFFDSIYHEHFWLKNVNLYLHETSL